MKLAYWDLRGLGEPARLMLAYGKVDYEDKRYHSDEEWKTDKHSLGLTFPNLPYLVDGETKLTESQAIYKYIAKKLNLLPCSENETQDCNVLEGIAHDLRLRLAMLVYVPGMLTTQMEETKKTATEKLGYLDKYFEGRKFVAGERLTYVDFDLYETLDHNRTLFTGILDERPHIREYIKRFESLDEIDRYLNSDGYKKFPIYGAQAQWGGKQYDDRTW